jgi:hypothetical protein
LHRLELRHRRDRGGLLGAPAFRRGDDVLAGDPSVLAGAADAVDVDAELLGELANRWGRQGLGRHAPQRFRFRFRFRLRLPLGFDFDIALVGAADLLAAAAARGPFVGSVADEDLAALPRLGCVGGCLERHQRGADLDALADVAVELVDDARVRRGDLHQRLLGLDLDERLVQLDLFAFLDEPGDDLGFLQPFAEIGKLELAHLVCHQ